MATPSFLDKAAGFATCNLLSTAGNALVGVGVTTLAVKGVGLVPLTLGSLSLLAAGAACQPTPVDGTPIPPGRDGCQEASPGGYGVLEGYWNGQWIPQNTGSQASTAERVAKINSVTIIGSANFLSRAYITTVGLTGFEFFSPPFQTREEAEAVKWRIDITNGTCADNVNPVNPYPPGSTDPVEYIDADTNCTYNISLQGFAADVAGGEASPVWKIETAPAVRAGGGIVGGCNFEPVIYQQPPGGGGPPRIGPWDPTWPDWDGGSGEPPWLDFLKGLAGGAAAGLTEAALEELLDPVLPATSREIYAACQYKEDGTPETYSVNFAEQKLQDRMLSALDAIVDFQQQFFLWKSPVCSNTPQPVTGDPVSINWVSDEYSPNGNNRIRKLLTYFDQNGSTLEQTVAHWKDFSWQAGPVIVSVNGVPLGKPQVWASSEAEAKRVINHAAAIAGVDMTNAEWLVTSPRASRYGMAGTMRVHRGANGALGITKRDGPNGLPPALT